MTRCLARWVLSGATCLGAFAAAAGPGPLRQVGVASLDITPNYPVRLAGYAVRKSESEGVTQHLWAKALAIGSDRERPAVLITVDTCGFPLSLRAEVVRRLRKKNRIDPDRVAICATHTHSAPLLAGYLANLFGGPLPADQQERVDRYTRQFIDGLETVALQALGDRQPGQLFWGQSQAGFAANRRTPGGPTDHDLPILFVTDPEGKLRAIFASYACHCTTLGGEFNRVCGDWAGYAQEYLARNHPGAVALIALGCGGDANPQPRSTLELAQQHGQEIAAAVDQLWSAENAVASSTNPAPHALQPVEGKLACRSRLIELPFDPLPTRVEWESRARQTNHVGNHARLNLARLDRGETLRSRLPYLVQCWSFDHRLAMVFMAGEVVVDYSLRLKREFDPARLWVNAYANDVPCYIPSERILKEGGYEGGGAMIYYDQPTRLAPGLEDMIVRTVHQLVPRDFRPRPPASAPAESVNP
jgi:neutral/alkaline ceramidase-like enzyme